MGSSDQSSTLHEYISSWITSVPKYSLQTPPPDYDWKPPPASKRKRSMSLPGNVPTSSSQSSGSPKRRRTDDAYDVLLEQSASQLGSDNLTLNLKTTLSPPASRVSSSSNRSSSPTRETLALLRGASPPVLTEGLNGLREAPPEYVERLGDLLAAGLDSGFIPHALQNIIKNDVDVGHQITKPNDFDRNILYSADIATMWKEVKEIFLNARDCKDRFRDENAWCDDVVRPLLRLAIKLYGDNVWWLQNVQSQTINPLYLSTVPVFGTSRKPIDRKADYVLSYSHRHPKIAALYEKLEIANRREVGHTIDTFTKRTALFSGFEIKPSSGARMEAEVQISVWIAASLRKKQELAQAAQIQFELAKIVEPALIVVGHDHSVYFAYPRENLLPDKSGVHILGPDTTRFEGLSTDSIRGVFRLLRFYGNLMKYGMNEEADGYWGGFLRPTLEKLAGISDKVYSI